MNNPWRPVCDYLCERSDLVNSILQRVRDTRVVIIRFIPVIGKTILLKLLGYHIHKNCPDLEPIFIEWKTEKQRNDLPYGKYLQEETAVWKAKNAEIRPHNPKATNIFLIDEGQNSYRDVSFWNEQLKNPNILSQPKFIIVCPRGISGLSAIDDSDFLSQVRRIDRFQCVELRSSINGNRHMLFKPIETHTMVMKWATVSHFQFESGISEYLHAITDGHPGILVRILTALKLSFTHFSANIRRQRLWTLDLCYSVMDKQNGFLDLLSKYVRGCWTPDEEALVRQYHSTSLYSHIPFSRIVEVLRKVATLLHGYTLPTSYSDKAFAFCHHVGLLQTEQRRPGSDETTYFFASPIHRKIACRRLLAASEPDTILDQITLQQTCLNAIERFNLSLLKAQSMKPYIDWRSISETAIQNEIYCCLNHELHNIEIISEYSYLTNERVDFYIFSKKWGIEILQSGEKGAINEYISQFRVEGKYHGWGIMDDFIILNFCSKSSFQPLEIKDVDIQSHILQVAIDFEEYTAEVYTYDNKLQVTLDLGRGRQRSYSGEPDTNQESLNPYMQLRDSEIPPNESEKTMHDLRKECAQLKAAHAKMIQEIEGKKS
ncbi:hypothetical protein OCU04_005998 [Sclerotinia nivalis]|nr:hypothetical protein OCU04_005998 [Sclerotinia nivalis]